MFFLPLNRFAFAIFLRVDCGVYSNFQCSFNLLFLIIYFGNQEIVFIFGWNWFFLPHCGRFSSWKPIFIRQWKGWWMKQNKILCCEWIKLLATVVIGGGKSNFWRAHAYKMSGKHTNRRKHVIEFNMQHKNFITFYRITCVPRALPSQHLDICQAYFAMHIAHACIIQ